MDQLLLSRLDKDEQVTRLDNLSPQKFGRGAFAKLSYTPSKLASNVIYKDAIQLKKTEENGSKLRQFQALNQILKDKLRHLQSEKQGIEQSLTQQINMYKKMIAEIEEAQQQRLHDLQYAFNEEILKIIQDKEEEAKYVQSEKQMMENRIYELEDIIGSLKEELNNRAIALQKSAQQLEKLCIQHSNANEKIQQLGKQLRQSNQNARKDVEQLSQRLGNQQDMHKATIQKMNLQRLKQIQHITKLHQAELEKVENQMQKQLTAKNQEIKDLKSYIQAETKRFNESIAKKDEYIQTLSQNLSDQKEKLLKITKQYTLEIANLCNEKKQLEQECQTFLRSFQKEKEETKRLKATSSQTTSFFEQQIQRLKKDLELTHLDMLKQRQRFYIEKDELKREILILRKNAQQNGRLMDQNSILCKEVKSLKELLMESSMEMQRCKDQFVRLGAQKQAVIAKLRQLDIQNETLHRLNVQREEEARAWRQSYYKYRK